MIESDPGLEPLEDIPTSRTISAMLPHNRPTTLPILALATKVDMAMLGDDYEIACDCPPNHAAVSARKYSHVFFGLHSKDEHDWDSFMAHGLADVVECFGRAPLTRLTVMGDHGHGTLDAWESVFRTFPRLEELRIGGPGDSDSRVTDGFLGLHAASTHHADFPVACQNLKCVGVVGLGLEETYEAMEGCFRCRGDEGSSSRSST